MKIYNKIPLRKIGKRTVISIGSFDGVHLGHQELLERNLKKSGDSYKSVVITFFPTPQAFLFKDTFIGYLNSRSEKIEKIKEKGVDILCCLEFNNTLRNISAEDFLKKIIKIFAPIAFIIGYDHSFGYKKRGDLKFLEKNKEKYSYQVIEISKIKHKDLGEISSSKIRDFLLNREVLKVNSTLGYRYRIKGRVISGSGLGKKIKFPTANIKVRKEEKILPSTGVYFVKAYLKSGQFYGMCNIGFRPTVSNLAKESIEVHLFDFNEDIYKAQIDIEFLNFIRNEKKFENISLLKNQLEKDRNKCLEYSINNV